MYEKQVQGEAPRGPTGWCRTGIPTRPALDPSLLALSVVSLLNDVSSDMIYPLLPAFVTGVLGAGPAFFGLLDGAAETVSSVVKLLGGTLSDRQVRRKPLVVIGYVVGVGSRVCLAVVTTPWQALAARVSDRVGKGLRTAPRDALLATYARASGDVDRSSEAHSGETRPDGRRAPRRSHGLTFGFHRAMDHLGATLGALLASALISCGVAERTIFAAAALPGALAILVLLARVREAPRDIAGPATAAGAAGRSPVAPPHARVEGDRKRSPWAARRRDGLDPELRRLLAAVALFTLANSSDGFILLLASERGLDLALVPLLWVAMHLVKAAALVPGGMLSDRIGRRRVLLAGWLLYGAVYAGYALSSSMSMFLVLTAAYGLHFGLSEGVLPALVADLAPLDRRGLAFGALHLTLGLGALPASLLMGGLWQAFGPAAAFGLAAGAAWAAAALLVALHPWRR